MKSQIVIAPDKFKGSLTAWEAADAIAQGLQSAGLDEDRVDLLRLPIADGGEGTSEVVLHALGGEWIKCSVQDALGRIVEAGYAMVQQDGTRVAVLEMSLAAGLWRLGKDELGRRNASTRGVGEMILHAVSQGAERILLGLGGSATNDGGSGMAAALGIRFLDEAGKEVMDVPAELQRVAAIDFGARFPIPEVVALCDVTNPLLGPLGCSRVFGPQKGIRPEEMAERESGLAQLAKIVERSLGVDFAEHPGAGAAGGLGFGCLAFADARIEGGFSMIAKLLGLEEKIRASRLVVTGEGSLDLQTLNGKGPHGVARLAKQCGRPVLAFCGVSDGRETLKQEFDEIRVLKRPDLTLEDCVLRAQELLEAEASGAAEWVIRKIEG